MLIFAVIFPHSLARQLSLSLVAMKGWGSASSKRQVEDDDMGSKGGASSKVRAVSPNENAELMNKALALMAKLTLKHELEIRELQAAVFRTYLLKDDNNFVQKIKIAVGTYIDGAKKQKTPPGEVHAYAWEALTAEALKIDIPAAAKDIIEHHRASIASPEALASIVYATKLKKTFHKNVYKLCVAGSPRHQDLFEAIEMALVKSGAEPKRGQAPQAGMARELQSLVDRLTEMA